MLRAHRGGCDEGTEGTGTASERAWKVRGETHLVEPNRAALVGVDLVEVLQQLLVRQVLVRVRRRQGAHGEAERVEIEVPGAHLGEGAFGGGNGRRGGRLEGGPRGGRAIWSGAGERERRAWWDRTERGCEHGGAKKGGCLLCVWCESTSPPDPSQWSAALKCDHRMLMANIWMSNDLNSPTLTTCRQKGAQGRGQGCAVTGEDAWGTPVECNPNRHHQQTTFNAHLSGGHV